MRGVVLCVPLHSSISVLAGHFLLFRSLLLTTAKVHFPQTIGDEECLGIVLRLLMNDMIGFRFARRMNMEPTILGFASQNSQFLDKSLLLFKRQVLVAEKD